MSTATTMSPSQGQSEATTSLATLSLTINLTSMFLKSKGCRVHVTHTQG